jgi:hypothetical protein
MADIIPIGVDRTSGQARTLKAADGLTDDAGNPIMGLQGNTGIQGNTGAVLQGNTGAVLQGSTGIQGNTGAVLQGGTGIQGSTGASSPLEALGSAYQFGHAVANHGTNDLENFGLLASIVKTNGDGAGTAATPRGPYFSQQASASPGSVVHIATAAFFRGSAYPYFRYAGVMATAITNIRMFSGFAVSESAALAGDSPATVLVGLSFSTGNSDTNFQILSDSAGSSPTRIDTGVAVTDEFTFEILSADAGVTWSWKLWNSVMVVGAAPSASGSFTADIPSVSTNMKAMTGITSLASAARQIHHYKMTAGLGYY